MLDFISLLLLAFLLEMVDNGLGGGFGTILSPLLIILGYQPKAIVPAVLVSEAVSGIWGGGWHIKFQNVNFKAVGLTLCGSLAAMAIATYVTGSILPSSTVKQIITILAVIMGIFVMARSYLVEKLEKIHLKNHPSLFVLLGALIGYNKGSSGGNYGPFSVTTYMVLGISAATAIGTTTIAEGIACALGVVMYSQITGFVLSLALPITLGAFIADPISAWVNNGLKLKLKPPFHGRLIGAAMTLIGAIALLKTLGII